VPHAQLGLQVNALHANQPTIYGKEHVTHPVQPQEVMKIKPSHGLANLVLILIAAPARMGLQLAAQYAPQAIYWQEHVSQPVQTELLQLVRLAFLVMMLTATRAQMGVQVTALYATQTTI